MKKLLLFFAICFVPGFIFAQGASISRKPKIKTPYVTESGVKLEVGQDLRLLMPKGDENQFLFVMALNKFNEPIVPATAKMAYKKQPILFFKEEDGVTYAFTNFFSVNIEAALQVKEIELPSE